MGKLPKHIREIVADNIRALRKKKFPDRGGAKECAGMFGVSPQQWSPWETGKRTPDELRLQQIAEFFEVQVDYFYVRHPETSPASAFAVLPEKSLLPSGQGILAESSSASGASSCPHNLQPAPGQSTGDSLRRICRLAECFFDTEHGVDITFRIEDSEVINFVLKACIDYTHKESKKIIEDEA